MSTLQEQLRKAADTLQLAFRQNPTMYALQAAAITTRRAADQIQPGVQPGVQPRVYNLARNSVIDGDSKERAKETEV